MRYYQLMNGSFEVGSFFTYEAKHYYIASLPWEYQRQILWETSYHPTAKVIDLKTIKTMLEPADSKLH